MEARNTGRKPAKLIGYELLVNQPRLVIPLKLLLEPTFNNGAPEAKEIAVERDHLKQISLTATTMLKAACRPGVDECYERIRKQLARSDFRMTIVVEESGRWWQLLNAAPYTQHHEAIVPGGLIEDFIAGVCCYAQ